MNNPLLMLPDRVRMAVYLVVGIAALTIGAIDVFFGDNDPEWLSGAVRVAAYLGGVLGLTAATHVPAAPDAQPARIMRHGSTDRGFDV